MSLKEKLNELGITPSKGLGQNFLVSDSAYAKIIEAGEIKRGERILEIGPGLGTLTEHLIQAGAEVVAIEKDRKLISFLQKQFHKTPVTILEGDALEFNPQQHGLEKDAYKVIANIPYYISSRLLRNIFELWPRPELIVLLVQREVAQRIITKPPHMNILALSVQYYADPKIISKVSKGSFHPVPEVDSAIIQLRPRVQVQDPVFEKKFFQTIRIGFAAKRKKLINNLSTGLKIDKSDLEKTLTQVKIDLNARPENLTIPQWKELTKVLLPLL